MSDKWQCVKNNFVANRDMTNGIIFGNHINTAVGLITSGAIARTLGTVTPLQVAANLAKTGSVSITNMTSIGTIASAGVNMLGNGIAVGASLETGITVGSGVNALIQAYIQNDCK